MASIINLVYQEIHCRINFYHRFITGNSGMIFYYDTSSPDTIDNVIQLPIEIPTKTNCTIKRVCFNNQLINWRPYSPNENDQYTKPHGSATLDSSDKTLYIHCREDLHINNQYQISSNKLSNENTAVGNGFQINNSAYNYKNSTSQNKFTPLDRQEESRQQQEQSEIPCYLPDDNRDLLSYDLMNHIYNDQNVIHDIIILEIPVSQASYKPIMTSRKRKTKRHRVEQNFRSTLRISIEFQLKIDNKDCTPLFINEQWSKNLNGIYNQYQVLIQSQPLENSIPWFPTIPCFAYNRSLCHWKCKYEVPKGLFAVGPGRIIDRISNEGDEYEMFVYSSRTSVEKLQPNEICLFVGNFECISGNEGTQYPIIDSKGDNNMDNTSSAPYNEKVSQNADKNNEDQEELEDALESSEDEKSMITHISTTPSQVPAASVISKKSNTQNRPNTLEVGKNVQDSQEGNKRNKTSATKYRKAPHVSLLTLKGFEEMLDISSAGVALCLKSYEHFLHKNYPYDNLTLLFIPFIRGYTMERYLPQANLNQSGGLSGSLKLISDTNLIYGSIKPMESSIPIMKSINYGSTIILPLDTLHTAGELYYDERCIESRILIAEAIASLWTPSIAQLSHFRANESLYMSIAFRKFLADQYIESNFGSVELNIRRWERIQRYTHLVESGEEIFPLHVSNSVVPIKSLVYSECYNLKSATLFPAVERFFSNYVFLPDNFFILIMRAYANLSSKRQRKGLYLSSEEFWQKMLHECLRKYIKDWNSKPQNKTMDRQIQLDKKLIDSDEILKHHEPLRLLFNDWEAFHQAYIAGMGCCQINIGCIVQLQRKGTSMDHFGFYVDQQPLEPPMRIEDDSGSSYFASDLAGRSVFNFWLACHIYHQKMQDMDIDGAKAHKGAWETLTSMFTSPSDPEQVDLDLSYMKDTLKIQQSAYDPIDAFGRDGNFVLGFGYVGTLNHEICIGYGELWNHVKSLQSKFKLNLSQYSEKCLDSKKFTWTPVDEGFPVATNGGMAYWHLLLCQYYNLRKSYQSFETLPAQFSKLTPSYTHNKSAGFGKYWPGILKLQIVEDDGFREEVRRFRDGILPLRFNVDPRSERGRKKVALKGDKPVANDSTEVGVIEPDYSLYNEPSSQRSLQFIGESTDNDRNLIEVLKKVVVDSHPEYLKLDNRSLVAKVCSKSKLPILWIRVDPDLHWIARFRRSQSLSMWEQQLLNDNNPTSQLEAATAIAYLYPSDTDQTESVFIRCTVDIISKAIRQHRWHPSIRSRCIYSLAILHNRLPQESSLVVSVFQNYINDFHAISDIDPPLMNKQIPSEMRFLCHFYCAASMLRNQHGVSPPDIIHLLLRPLRVSLEVEHKADYLNFCSKLISHLGNLRFNYLLQPHQSELKHPYFKFLRDIRTPFCDRWVRFINSDDIKSSDEEWYEPDNNENSKSTHNDRDATSINKFINNELEMVWLNIWRFFRLDCVPYLSSRGKRIASSTIHVLSNNIALLDIARSKLLDESEYMTPFDFMLFLPLPTHLYAESELTGASELHRAYFDPSVHKQALYSILYLCCTGSLKIFKLRSQKLENNQQNQGQAKKYFFRSIFTNEKDQSSSFLTGSGILTAIELASEIEKLTFDTDWAFSQSIWEVFFECLQAIKYTFPPALLPFSSSIKDILSISNNLKERFRYSSTIIPNRIIGKDIIVLGHIDGDYSLNYWVEMLEYSKLVVSTCCSTLWKELTRITRTWDAVSDIRTYYIRSIYSILFGYGDPTPNIKRSLAIKPLQTGWKKLLHMGVKMKQICIFKQKYIERELPYDWIDLSHDAVISLCDMPEAKFFLDDPESIIENYRSYIKEPIWLRKVEAKARNRIYKMAMELKSDISKIFRNAREILNHLPNIEKLSFDWQSMKKDCQVLEETFESLWPVISRSFQAHEKRKLV